MRIQIKKYERRFQKTKGIIKIKSPQGKPVDAYTLAYSASLHLLVRSKYLFFSTLDESKKRNAYAAYVLVRSFFETCMALGYLTIKLDKKTNENDSEGVWKLAHRILQGGKYFPSEEFLKETGTERVSAINVYDYLDEVDRDMRRVKNIDDTSFSPHREMYNTALSEFGHPNYLGLAICSSLKRSLTGNLSQEIYLNRSMGTGDKKNYSNYLSWGSLIFFFYWDRLIVLFKKHGLELPKLKADKKKRR